MKRLLNVTVLLILLAGCLYFGPAGCDKFWQKGDEIVHDVNTIAQGTQAVLESPAGRLIPPGLKVYGLIGIGLINAAVIGWEEIRNRQMKKTTKAIIKGIERTDNPQKATSEVKANIAEEMRRQGGDKFYAKANKIVDQLKIS